MSSIRSEELLVAVSSVHHAIGAHARGLEEISTRMRFVANHIQRILPILETIQSSMASGTFNLPASSFLATPSKSPAGDALPLITDHEAERVKRICQKSEGGSV
jgi:hypothetical protein